MKKIMILTVLVGMLFGGCSIDSNINDKMKSPSYPQNMNTGKSPDEQSGSPKDKMNEMESRKSLETLLKLVENGKKPVELIGYIDREIKKVSVDSADEMVLALEEVQEVFNTNFYQPKFFNTDYSKELSDAAKSGVGVEIVERVKDKGVKSLLKEVFNSGYKLKSSEGIVYPVKDYSSYKKYEEFVSKKVAEYIEIMEMISDKVVSDGAILVSWDELSSRLLRIENYTKTYKEFERTEALQNQHNRLMWMYLGGLDNTPAYNFKTRVYKDEVIKSYNHLINNYGDSKSAQTVKEYLNIIGKKNYTFSDEADKFISKIYNPNSPQEKKYKYMNHVLAKLLPEKAGYHWTYNGFAEYGHDMKLEEIIKGDHEIKYIIKGKVADMSDGESGKGEDYYKIDLAYVMKDAGITQTKSEKIMMDSDFDRLELIRAPLIQGNKWFQMAVDKEGKERFLNCEITGVNEIGNSRVYTVKYKDQDSDYYETRMFEEGIGVVSFAKLWKSIDNNSEIGYGLYKDASGY